MALDHLLLKSDAHINVAFAHGVSFSAHGSTNYPQKDFWGKKGTKLLAVSDFPRPKR